MKISKHLVVVATIYFPLCGYAETKYYLESDPIAFALKGYSLHGGLESSGFRFQAGVFGAEVPKSLRDNKDFEVKQRGVGIKVDYYGRNPGGVFYGLEYGHTKKIFTLSSTNEKEERPANLIGIRTGYKYIINDRFYLTPWISLKRNISSVSPVELSGQTYHDSAWQVFATIHLGVQF
jgi:hypothetical protein